MKRLSPIIFLSVLLFTAFSYGCKESLNSAYITDEQYQLITEYFDEHPELSMFQQMVGMGVIERQGQLDLEGTPGTVTIRYEVLLGTRGNYTVFAPENDAIEAYLETLGLDSVPQMSTQQVKEFLDFHVILSKVALRSQRTGLFNSYADTTMTGVRHFVDVRTGFSNIILNKEAKVIGTAEVSNGFVYHLNHVLNPHPSTVYAYLKNTGRFEILSDAIDACNILNSRGDKLLADTFGVADQPHPYITGSTMVPFFTFLAIPDDVFEAAGISSVAQLLAWLRAENADLGALSDDELLRDYIFFLNLKGQQDKRGISGSQDYGKFTFQMARYDTERNEENILVPVTYSQNLETLLRGYAININDLNGDALNPLLVVNGNEIQIDNAKADVGLKNGVIHELTGVPAIGTEHLVPTKMQKEIEDGFREYSTPLGWKQDKEDIRANLPGSVWNIVRYSRFTTSNPTSDQGHGLRYNPVNTNDWLEVILRNVPAGTYNVLFNYRQTNDASSNILVYFRNDKNPSDWRVDQRLNLVNMRQTDASSGQPSGRPDYQQNYLLGTVVCEEYGDYTLRFVHQEVKFGEYDSVILVPVDDVVEE